MCCTAIGCCGNDEFDPNRFLGTARTAIDRFAYLPFGVGPRICIGSGFALQEATLVVATVMKHFRLEPVPAGASGRCSGSRCGPTVDCPWWCARRNAVHYAQARANQSGNARLGPKAARPRRSAVRAIEASSASRMSPGN